ncbi:hypothetical protein ACVW0I_002202 [Bradyrhizobium sp. LM6.11]
MLLPRLQGHQVDDIDDAHLQVGQCLAQEVDRGERFQRRHVTGAGHHHVGLLSHVFRAGPAPDADAGIAMRGRFLHRQPLRRRLLAGDDHVDAIIGAQAMVRDPQQRVGIRREVDADDVGLLVGDEIDEAGILMAEAVVVLARQTCEVSK